MSGDLLADFLSRDPHRIRVAASAVMRSWDRAELRALATRAGDIRAATEGVDLGGMFRSNSTHLDFALRKLTFAEGEACLCGLYTTHDMFAPSLEAKYGRVEVLSEHTAEGVGHYACRCCTCGQFFSAREETGYHYDWYVWEAVP